MVYFFLSILQSKWYGILFFIFGVIVFAPFFVEGKVVLASTDQLFAHYPNLLYGYRSLSEGVWPLWNPYLFLGVDLTTSMHHHILHPSNWFLYFIPEQYVFQATTFRHYLEFSLLGCFAFKTFRFYQKNTWSAFILAVIAQLGGFSWFVMTTFIGIHLLLISFISIYLIVSHEGRSKLINYVLLSLCFFDILAMGHVGYTAAFGLPIIFTCLSIHWPQILRRPWGGVLPVALLAAVTGLLMAGYRIFPVLQGLINEQMAVQNMWLPNHMGATGYFALTGFIPESLGLYLGDSASIFNPMGVSGRHNQFHNLLYFGVVSILFVYLAVFGTFGKKYRGFSMIFIFIAITPLYLIQPISDLVNLLIFPLHHDIIPRTLTYFSILLALHFCFKKFENGKIDLKESHLGSFIVMMGVVSAILFSLWLRMSYTNKDFFGEDWNTLYYSLRVLIFFAVGGSIFYVWKCRIDENSAPKFTNSILGLFLIVTGFVYVYATEYEVWTQWAALQGYLYAVGGAGWAWATLIWARRLAREEVESFYDKAFFWVLFTGVLILLFYPTIETLEGRNGYSITVAGVMGEARFLLLCAILIEVFAYYINGKLSSFLILPILALFVVGDLLFALKNYSHVGAKPFVTLESLYPKHAFDNGIDERKAWAKAPSAVNLLKNPDFSNRGKLDHSWTIGGENVDLKASQLNKGIHLLTMVHSFGDYASLFQDVKVEKTGAGYSFGIWAKTDVVGKVGLAISVESFGLLSSMHTGSGKWEWMTVSTKNMHENGNADRRVSLTEKDIIRPQILVNGFVEVSFLGPRLIMGPIVTPYLVPGDAIHRTEALGIAENGPLALNLKSYRMNHANRAIKIDDTTWSSIPMVYNIPSYSGIDSDVKQGLYELIQPFEPDTSKWFARPGVRSLVAHPRILDLMGVKYEAEPDGSYIIRPNALARLSLFNDYEVVKGSGAMIQRMKQKSFDPTKTLLVEEAPEWASVEPRKKKRFLEVPFQVVSVNEIEASLNLEQPGVLLFNEGYSPYWRAFFNGKPLVVFKANGYFMGINIPATQGKLVLEFYPRSFLMWAEVTKIMLLTLLLALGVSLIYNQVRKKKELQPV